MKNITLSADEHLIEHARQVARERNTTLNQAFRDWLQTFIRREPEVSAIESLYARLTGVNSGGRKYSREEMNER
jgi:GTP1/Obg family GTP-binding protein